MDASEQERITNADNWAQEELGKADFGDKRLTKRFTQIMRPSPDKPSTRYANLIFMRHGTYLLLGLASLNQNHNSSSND